MTKKLSDCTSNFEKVAVVIETLRPIGFFEKNEKMDPDLFLAIYEHVGGTVVTNENLTPEKLYNFWGNASKNKTNG